MIMIVIQTERMKLQHSIMHRQHQALLKNSAKSMGEVFPRCGTENKSKFLS